jgi:hypothetical protein
MHVVGPKFSPPAGPVRVYTASERLRAAVFISVVAAALISFVGLLSASLSVGLIGVVCLIVIFRIRTLVKREPTFKQSGLVVFLLFSSLAISILIYPLTILAHLVPFSAAAWTATLLYVAAVALCLRSELSRVFKILTSLIGITMVLGLVIFPAPAGSADPADKSEEWSIELTVLNDRGKPITGALAECTAVMVWDHDVPFRVSADVGIGTDSEGKAKFTFHEDTRLKAALCEAMKDGGAYEPDYPPQTAILASPFRGGDYHLQIMLIPKSHQP